FEPSRGVRGGGLEREVASHYECRRRVVAGRGFRLAQQRQSQPERDVIADALDEGRLTEAEVRLPAVAHEGDGAPASAAAPEDRAQLRPEPELSVDLAIAGTALRLSVCLLTQRRHGPSPARELAELREVGFEQLVLDEAPAHGGQPAGL